MRDDTGLFPLRPTTRAATRGTIPMGFPSESFVMAAPRMDRIPSPAGCGFSGGH